MRLFDMICLRNKLVKVLVMHFTCNSPNALILQKCITKKLVFMKIINITTLLSTIKCLLHGFVYVIASLH